MLPYHILLNHVLLGNYKYALTHHGGDWYLFGEDSMAIPDCFFEDIKLLL
jgi:hypothetical protein